MAILKYHQESLELTGYGADFNRLTLPNLPASVSEWFSLKKGIVILAKHSNQDVPVPPEKFQRSKFKDKNLSIFMYENQRVVCWAFENSNIEDPPVYINYAPPVDNFSEEVVSEEDCFLVEETFSRFVYKWIFDHFNWYQKGKFLIEKSKETINNEILESLNMEFTKAPFDFSESGEVLVYRYLKSDQKIIIFKYNEKTVWQLTANTEKSFNNLYKKFEHLF